MTLDFIEILKIIFLGIVEGITEWLPQNSLFSWLYQSCLD